MWETHGRREGIIDETIKIKKEKLMTQLLLTVQKMGLEPTQYCYHTDLNRTRLPIPPLLHLDMKLSVYVIII